MTTNHPKWNKLDNVYLISEELSEFPYYLIRKATSTVAEPIRIEHDYVSVVLHGKRKRLHRVIYEHYVEPIPDGLVIDHINHDRRDNRLSNLRAVTIHENCLNLSRFDWIDLNVDELIPLKEYHGKQLLDYYIGKRGVYKSNTQKYRFVKSGVVHNTENKKMRLSKRDILDHRMKKRILDILKNIILQPVEESNI